jgi:hypothetical protein
VLERLPARAPREDVRAVWMEAMRRPGLIAPHVPDAAHADHE